MLYVVCRLSVTVSRDFASFRSESVTSLSTRSRMTLTLLTALIGPARYGVAGYPTKERTNDIFRRFIGLTALDFVP